MKYLLNISLIILQIVIQDLKLTNVSAFEFLVSRLKFTKFSNLLHDQTPIIIINLHYFILFCEFKTFLS